MPSILDRIPSSRHPHLLLVEYLLLKGSTSAGYGHKRGYFSICTALPYTICRSGIRRSRLVRKLASAGFRGSGDGSCYEMD